MRELIMSLSKTLLVGLCAAFVLSSPVLASEKKEGGKEEKGGHSNQIKGTMPTSYIQIPKMRLAVSSDFNRQFHQLEMEAWISVKNPEQLAMLNSSKKKMNAALKDDMSNYKWEAFQQPGTGLDLAKDVVRNSVFRSTNVKLDDVVLRTFVIH